MDARDDLRKRDREHLKKLGPIREELAKYFNPAPLDGSSTPQPVPVKPFLEASKQMAEWQEERNRILAEYSRLP